MVATVSLVQEADKLTLGQNLTLTAPHTVETMLCSASDQPRLTFSRTRCLNPATLLPDPDFTMPVHDCQELLEITETSRPDLQDVLLEKADTTVSTDNSSFLEQGVRRAGAAITTETYAQALPAGASAQKAELIALTQAVRWVHVHGASCRECGLLTSAGKTIKNKEEILALPEAVWLPQQVAVIHCKGHQKEDTAFARGNKKADSAAREAARLLVTPLVLLPAVSFLQPELPDHPAYSPEEEKQALDLQPTWAQINAKQDPRPELGHRLRECSPGERWEIDFTEIKARQAGYQYLLVMAEAFATRNKTASTVVKFLLNKIIAGHGLPFTIGSDNGPASTSSIAQSQGIKHSMEAPLYLSTSELWRHRTRELGLEKYSYKLILETGKGWTQLLPLALLRVKCTPCKTGFFLFEIMYERAPPILPRLKDTHLAEISQANLLRYLQSLHNRFKTSSSCSSREHTLI
ncbi:LOW QUALITY PROTEIN: hypothetical protein AAY473_026173 [Plecturocebus cupreus]